MTGLYVLIGLFDLASAVVVAVSHHRAVQDRRRWNVMVQRVRDSWPAEAGVCPLPFEGVTFGEVVGLVAFGANIACFVWIIGLATRVG